MNESFPKEVEARIREACNKNPQTIKHICDFLAEELGKEAVSDIELLQLEDQIQACLNHIAIGFEVGDIRMKDIDNLLSS